MTNEAPTKRRRLPLVAGTFAAGLALGLFWPSAAQDQAPASANAEAPLAYVLVAGRVIDEAGLGPYGEKAGPLAQAAGIEVLARADAGDVLLMEGATPFEDGFVAIETFRSMADFESFWNSPGYQEAIGLREGKVELDFVVALEGMAPGAP